MHEGDNKLAAVEQLAAIALPSTAAVDNPREWSIGPKLRAP